VWVSSTAKDTDFILRVSDVYPDGRASKRNDSPFTRLDSAMMGITDEQSYSGTDLLGALEKARQIGQSESSQPARTLHLISDATRSAWEPANSAAPAGAGAKFIVAQN
jgi:hypothetical protein